MKALLSVLVSLLLHVIILKSSFNLKNDLKENIILEKVIKIKLVGKLIVDVPKTGKKEIPLKSDFEGKRNQKVFEQTVSKKKKKKVKLSDLSIGNGKKLYSSEIKSEDLSYLDDIKVGASTQLNTTENKYFSFYNRIKPGIDFKWNNKLTHNLRRIHRIGNFTCITKLLIKFDSNGYIISIRVTESSGFSACDETAIHAIEKSQPFRNPPRGLIAEGGSMRWIFIYRERK